MAGALQAGDPQRVGPYVLTGRLGSGGMGRVYLARSPGGRMVAVKVIRAQLAEDAGFRARFAREVSAARKVGGMFTAQVVDADIDGPVPWLVTAYIPGTPLSDAVEQQGPLPPQSVLALAAGLAEGLIAIHAAGVIHRDLKPSNVLLALDGPRIIDFGISSAAEATALTGTGYMIGSPGFMSPEQAEGLVVGPASDIFSLAGVLIYAARGEGPFGTGDTAALLYRVVHGKPNIDQIPDNLRPLIRRSLDREPRRRPTAGQFLTELSAAYPSAADLTDWLPPQVLNPPAGPGGQQPSIAGTFGSGFGGGVPAFSASAAEFGPGAAFDAPPGAFDAKSSAGHVPAEAQSGDPATGSSTSLDPSTRTSLATPTPLPPTQAPPEPGGPEGFPGSQGFPSSQGYPGAQDFHGAQGYSGVQDYPGSQGHPGSQGYQGSQGYPGPGNQGNPGDQGNQGYSPGPSYPGGQGSSGSQGYSGNQSYPGNQGNPGNQGYSPGQSYPGGQGSSGSQGYSGNQSYPGNQGYPGAQGQPGGQGYPGAQGYPGSQQYPVPQGYTTGHGDALPPAGSGIQPVPGGQGSQWWSGQQQPGGAPGGPGAPGSDQWYRPPIQPSPRRGRPKWLLPVGGAAVVLVVIVALVLALGGNSPKTPVAQQSTSTSPSQRATQGSSPRPSATPTAGNLLLGQFQVGDCLTGANMDLNKNTPWPKVTAGVPCSQSHTAEVFYSNLSFWPKSEKFPGTTVISQQANAECTTAFGAYDGIAYAKSMYTWTNIVPDASTWPTGDRALHCVAYYATSAQPAGRPITGSIKGTGK